MKNPATNNPPAIRATTRITAPTAVPPPNRDPAADRAGDSVVAVTCVVALCVWVDNTGVLVGGTLVSVAGGGTGVSVAGGVTCKSSFSPGIDDRAGVQPVPGHQLGQAHAIIAGDPRQRLPAADRVVILAIAVRGELLDGRQRARGGAGGEIARVDHQLLPDLQGPIQLQAVVRQDLIDTRPVGIRQS